MTKWCGVSKAYGEMVTVTQELKKAHEEGDKLDQAYLVSIIEDLVKLVGTALGEEETNNGNN